MFGTDAAKPRGWPGCRWRSTFTWSLLAKRRRRDSNPLEMALQATTTPCGFSVENACPRQESNLALDLRTVACLPHTPRTNLPHGAATRFPATVANTGAPDSPRLHLPPPAGEAAEQTPQSPRKTPPGHPGEGIPKVPLVSTPPRNRTSSDCFEHSHASGTPAGRTLVSRPGLEPGPEPSEGPMQSATPSGRKRSPLGTGPAG